MGIHRISWRDIIKPNATVNNADAGVSTGIVKYDNKLVIILDFEKIVTDISPETGLKVEEIRELGERERNDIPILMAEDSALLNKLISDSLKEAGYVNLIDCVNGQDAWDYIEQAASEGNVNEKVRVVITDIEMPIMDGHRLTKLIKSHDSTKQIPVVIFSSLVNEEMRRKGEQLGANAQLSKPEIGNLVRIIDKLVEETMWEKR